MKRHALLSTLSLLCASAVALLATPSVTSAATHSTVAAKATAATAKKAFPITLMDDAKRKVTVAREPQHIASTTEGTDEILSVLVPKRRIAMVTSYATDPTQSNVVSELKGIPQLKAGDTSAEGVLSVHPDLVLLSNYVNAGIVKQLEQVKLPVYEFADFNSIADIERNIKVVGELVGSTNKANQVVQTMNKDMANIQTKVKGQAKPRVLDISSYHYAAGRSTTVNDMIVDAGGINAASGLNGWASMSNESIVAMNPDVIIDSAADKSAFMQQVLSNPALATVKAVRNHRVYYIRDADLGSASQFVVRGVIDLARVLHPAVKLSAN